MRFHLSRLLTSARVRIILVFSILTAWPVAAQAGIELLSADVVEAQPREMRTVSVRVTNDSPEPQVYQIEADVPSGWGYVAMPETVEIPAGESTVVFLSINPPAEASAADYAVVLSAYPEGRPSEASLVQLTVRIPAVTLLQVRALRNEPPPAYSGDEIAQVFVVMNLGNARTRVAINTESREEWSLAVDPPDRRLDLEPNQSGRVTVSTVIPEELIQSETYRLTVVARSLEAEGQEWRASTSTRIIPRRLSAGSIYATLDGNVETQTSWRDDEDISAMLFIDTLESEIMEGRRVSLGPINLPITGRGTGSFGRSQWISAGYEDVELGYIRAGDFSIDLMAPLMGRYMSGRGGDVLYRSGEMDYRIFYTRSRGSIPEETMGVQVARRVGEDTVVRLTAMRDEELSVPEGYDREAESSTNLGLFVEYQPSEDIEVTGGIGRSSVSGSGSDNAWRLNARYELQRFSANCEWLRAGADFRGGWTDTELRRLNLSWSPLEDVNIWANYSQTRQNLEADPEEEGRRDRSMAFGATWNVEGFGRLRVSHRIDRTRDIVLEDFDRLTKTTEYSLSRDWGGFSLSASWQDRSDEDQLTGDRETDRTLRVDCAARLNRSASARIGYSSGWNRREETVRTTNISLSGDVELGSDWDLSIGVQRNLGGLQGRRTSVNGTLSWDMPGDSTLNLRVRSYTGGYGGDTEVALGFTYPLSIPLTMFPRKGSVEGRVFLADDPAHGIANVGVSIGQIEMVTDDNGNFSFPSLDPGEYQLTLDTTSLGVGMTPQVELPLVFAVEAGATVGLEIPVMQSVAIGGHVFLETPGSPGEAPSRRPLAEMVVELQAEDGSYYRFTDSYGRFLFADLVPGRYTVLLRSDWLPQWHEILGPASFELELAPGDSRRDLEFTVAPMERQIEVTTEFSSD